MRSFFVLGFFRNSGKSTVANSTKGSLGAPLLVLVRQIHRGHRFAGTSTSPFMIGRAVRKVPATTSMSAP